MTEVAKGKYIYGIVTVGERGQIVIPKKAREHFNIKPRDKLIVMGDIKKGIAIQKAGVMKELALKILGAFGQEESPATSEEESKKGHSNEEG